MDDSISINKFISSTGLCSRREADKLIDARKVKINGKVAQKGNRVTKKDKVLLHGKLVKHQPKSIYIALHKPEGITCTTDRKDKSNIIDFVQHKERIFPIGRLDKPSTGLILLTNDGDIVNKILRVENNHEKEYIVTVDRAITPDFIKTMSGGIPMLNTVTKKCKIKQMGKYAFRITLTQGLNRQIRRMCEYCDYDVVSLKRIRIMNIKLANLPVGKWRNLTPDEFKKLSALL